MSVYYYKSCTNNMAIRATLQTKLACGALIIIIINICFLIVVLAYISKEEMCKKNIDRPFYDASKFNNVQPIKHELQTTVYEHPWMLAFLILPDHIYVGGATIITKNWAITTADCVEKVADYPISKKVFRGGSTYWKKNGFYHYATEIIAHEKFNPYTLDYNVALALVASPFDNKYEMPLLITHRKFDFAETTADVTGWTNLYNTEEVYENLLSQEVVLLSSKDCNRTLNRVKNVSISFRSLCAEMKLSSNVRGCIFTSGSALVKDNSLIGLVSWGVTCNEIQWPGVYIYLKTVIDWITKIKLAENNSLELIS